MALMTVVSDSADDSTLLAIVADDQSGEYVWPEGVTPWFDGDARVAHLMDVVDEPPTAEQDWLALLGSNLGSVNFSEPESFTTLDEAISAADERIKPSGEDDGPRDEPGEDPDPTGLLQNASDSFDDISTDYSGFAEGDDGEDPQAMLNFLMSTLGPIDPAGPNGWILRAAEGEPHEGEVGGDAEMLIHFPGTMPPSEVLGQDDEPETKTEADTESETEEVQEQ